MTDFRHLFSPLRVGRTTVRNRLYMSAATVMFTTDNLISQRHVDFYEERARGGIGLIITEEIEVHPTGAGAPMRWLVGWKPEVVPAYRSLTEAIHRHGATILAQLDHAGAVHDAATFDQPLPSWSASALGQPGRETPKAMEPEDIEDLLEHYARSAVYAREGGFDGVELHAAHGHLLAQFLSPLSNVRDDDYGGSLENRMRLLLRAIECVRRAVGDHFTLGVRISAEEFAPGGMLLAETIDVCKRLASTGWVDFLDVSGGRPPYSYHRALPTFEQPQAHLASYAAEIRRAVAPVPVFLIGRVVDPRVAEQVLAAEQADMVGMLRGHIADPEVGNKAREGRLDEIKYCISCNQECLARVVQGRPIACIQNPTTGRERELSISKLQPAEHSKRVVIVGGGPAGLEAAWIAAKRGHRVELYERSEQLGGQARLHALLPRRREFGNLVRNLEQLVAKYGVAVHLGRDLAASDILAMGADLVILATGSTPRREDAFKEWRPDLPGLPGADRENVLTSWDVLLDRKSVGKRVVLLDGEGRHEAAVTAEFLAERGVDLHIITPFGHFAPALVPTLELGSVYRVLLAKGVRISPWTVPVVIDGDVVRVRQVHTGREREIRGVDTVVVHGGSRSNDALYRALKGQVPGLRRVGDCVHPRRIAHAMYEAHVLAREI